MTAPRQPSPSPSFTSTEVPDPRLDLTAVTDRGLGNTAWLANLDGAGLVVDPERDPAPYLSAARRRDVEVQVVVDTHLHADFVTGSPELASAGARIMAPGPAGLAWPHHALKEGEEVELGRWRLRALATPGHTPEHFAYLLLDGSRPAAVFTGGSLLVGGVARTDLIDPADTEHLTRLLWRSIHRELLTLPRDVLVLPTHGAGSFCSSVEGGARWSTIGAEIDANPLLAAAGENEFVRQVAESLGSYPPYFLRLRELNRLGPRIYGALPVLPQLGLPEVERLREQGSVVVDVRPVARFAAGHLPGSLANTLRPQFASWLGWLVEDPSTPLIFVTDGHTDRRELVRQCLNIGYENLAGELAGGTDAWAKAGGRLTSLPLARAEELAGRRLVDVRQTGEYLAGHVPGSLHVELGRLGQDPPALPEGPLALMCGHGERAATAASLLAGSGHDVAILDGGPGDWAAATGEPLAPA